MKFAALFKKPVRIVTHSGTFHADDIYACATVQLWLEKHGKRGRVTRTRDDKTITAADIVFDVGGEYDPARMRFDHHQRGGAGTRENGIPYAAFGLVWKHLGIDVCGGNCEVWESVDRSIAAPVDGPDNGTDISTPIYPGIYPYAIERYFHLGLPTWKEKKPNLDRLFKRNVRFAKHVLKREIVRFTDSADAADLLKKTYAESPDKRVLILGQHISRPEIQRCLVPSDFPELLYVLFPDSEDEKWRILCAYTEKGIFDTRKPLPQAWRGLRDPELEVASGIPGAEFCHASGFFAVAASKDTALAMAEKALAA